MSARPRVLVSDPLAPAAIEELRKHADVDARKVEPEELMRIVSGYDALLVRSETKVTRAVLEVASKLKVVGRAGVGVDNIDVEAAKSRGVVVVNAPLAAQNAVAELTILHMLALVRKFPIADGSTKAGKWEKKTLMGGELQGRTLGLIGVGRIGGRVAELARAFGMKVRFYDPYVPKEREHEVGGRKVDTVVEVVAGADVVSVHVPLTPETKNLVNAQLISSMKRGAIVVNCARGGVIDEVALYDALVSGELGGAGLDVFAVEPPKDSPLLKLPNVSLTPHLGASTAEAQDKAGLMVVEQVLKVLRGEKAEFRVA
ncbi:MAG: hydroxyacid dehydrogenase [Thermoplasmatota archaeon]